MVQQTIEIELRLSEALQHRVRRTSHREEGQHLTEYATIAALLSIVAIVIILAIGGLLQNLVAQISTTLGSV